MLSMLMIASVRQNENHENKIHGHICKRKLWLADMIPKHLLDEVPEVEREARCCVGFPVTFLARAVLQIVDCMPDRNTQESSVRWGSCQTPPGHVTVTCPALSPGGKE